MTSPRRILIVSYEYPPLGGGGGVIFRDLAQELARHLDVTVLTSGRSGLAPRETDGRLEIVRTPVLLRRANATASLASMLSFFPSSLWTGERELRQRSHELVHTSFAIPSGPSGILLARRHRLPHVLSIHGGDIWDPSKRLSPHRTPLLKQTVRRVIHASDRVVAQSNDTASRARKIYGERPLDIIPLAVRPVPFERVPRSALDLSLSDDDFVLVTIGRLIARKGLDQLLEILARLPQASMQLVVVGEGPERGHLEDLARAAGVRERIHFTGFVSEERKWQILACSDLYVSTSLHEGFGIVFLEAMEAGLPVLCYDRGGQTDFVDDEVGHLVPVDAVHEFLDRIERLSKDASLRRRIGAAARARAREFYVDRFAARYLRIYEECLANREA